jgi:cytochrome c
MRRLGLTIAAPFLAPLLAFGGLAAGLSGCAKKEAAAPEATAPAAPAAPASGADLKALQAKLPAPYNTADLDNGEAKFALCAACHTTTEGGPNMTGPNLHGVFGRKAGGLAGFSYSDPMKAAGWTWDAARIDNWIADPKVVLAGTKMTFAGMKDPKDRADVVAYLMVATGYKP